MKQWSRTIESTLKGWKYDPNLARTTKKQSGKFKDVKRKADNKMSVYKQHVN